MRVLRGVGGVLLWLVAALVGLVGALLCVTIVLLPVGIPLLMLSGRMFTSAVQLMVPPKVAHPVRELGKASRKRSRAAADAGGDVAGDVAGKVRKAGRTASKQATRTIKGKRSRRLRLG